MLDFKFTELFFCRPSLLLWLPGKTFIFYILCFSVLEFPLSSFLQFHFSFRWHIFSFIVHLITEKFIWTYLPVGIQVLICYFQYLCYLWIYSYSPGYISHIFPASSYVWWYLAGMLGTVDSTFWVWIMLFFMECWVCFIGQ